jgi:hypothetical protein
MYNKKGKMLPVLPVLLILLFSLNSILLAGCTADGPNPNGNKVGIEDLNNAEEKKEFEIPKYTDDNVKFETPGDDFGGFNLHGDTIEEAFSFDESLYRIEQIRESLDSFRILTEKSRGKLSDEIFEEVGNTDWEMQNLGFRNVPNIVEGTLRMQDYKVKRLEFCLAIEKYEKGELTKEEAEKAQNIYENAKAAMQEFLNSYTITD